MRAEEFDEEEEVGCCGLFTRRRRKKQALDQEFDYNLRPHEFSRIEDEDFPLAAASRGSQRGSDSGGAGPGPSSDLHGLLAKDSRFEDFFFA